MTELPAIIHATTRLASEGLLSQAATDAIVARVKARRDASADELFAVGVATTDPERGMRLKAAIPLSSAAKVKADDASRLLLGGALNRTADDYRLATHAYLIDNPGAHPFEVHLAASEYADRRFREKQDAPRAAIRRVGTKPTPTVAPAPIPAAIPAPAPLPSSKSVDDLVGQAAIERLKLSPTGTLPPTFIRAARYFASQDPTLTPAALVGLCAEYEGFDKFEVVEEIKRDESRRSSQSGIRILHAGRK